MSKKYPFEPLELQPFTHMDLGCLRIDEVGPPQPHWPPPSASTPSLKRSSFSDDDIAKSRSAYDSSTAYDPARYSSIYNSDDKRPSSPNSLLHTSFLQPKSRRFALTWVVAVLATVISAFTVYYTFRVMVDEDALPRYLSLGPGATVLVVNILSHLAAFLCWSLTTDTFEALRWAWACRPQGIPLATFLVLSRATPTTGVLQLLATAGLHQFWALQRYDTKLSLRYCTAKASLSHKHRYGGLWT